jgi:hypothetical protein
MRHVINCVSVIFAIVALVAPWTLSGAQTRKPLACNVGPVHMTFGDTPWLVYSCEDGKSLVVVSKAGSIAAPFYFVLAWRDGKYTISGEGNGSEAASTAAGRDLEAMSTADIETLVTETRAVARKLSTEP